MQNPGVTREMRVSWKVCLTTLASASLSREHQEHRARMVGPLTVSLGLGLATLTGSHMHRDSDARRSPRAQDPDLISQG